LYRTSGVEKGAQSGEERRHLQQMLLTLIEKADFLVEDDLNALMSVLPDRDKLLLKVQRWFSMWRTTSTRS
jgi:hypothetical protein